MKSSAELCSMFDSIQRDAKRFSLGDNAKQENSDDKTK